MSSPIHICILTSAHPTDDVRMRHKVAATFLGHGYRVTWVGPDYQYVSASVSATSESACEYRLFDSAKNRFARLVGSRLKTTASAVADVDVYYAPEPDSALVAAKLARRNRARVIFDVHELYHVSHVKNWAPRPLRPLSRFLVRMLIARICRRCDLVLGVSDGVLEPYREAAPHSMIVRNCAPSWFGGAGEAGTSRANRSTFRIMHGKSTAYNGTPIVLRAVALATARVRGIRVLMFEWFDREAEFARQALLADIERLGLREVVELRPPVRMDEMPSVLQSCDLGMISHSRLLEAGTQPNRLYEYMAAGLPVLAPSYDKGIAPVVEMERCGVLVDFEDPTSVADEIVRLRNDPVATRDMGLRAREAFLSRHNWDVEFRPVLEKISSWFPGRAST